MEERRLSSQPLNLLKKIKDFTRSLLVDLRDGRSPVVSIGRYKNYCTDTTGNCCCSSNALNGKDILSLRKECHARRIDVLLRVLLIVQKLLQENKHGSKRDIYYMHPSAFTEQAVVDRAIHDICILLQCSRHNLNVVSVGNGLVMGWLRFSEGERKYDCIKSPSTGHPVPVHVEEVKDIISVAEYVLVVEKETVFQRLANDRFCDKNRCIVITGRGYPDVPTRRFLRLLIENLHLPVYCLVDCDPYGFDILTTYRFGSMLLISLTCLNKQMAYDAKFLRVPEIRWLGAFPSDLEKYQLSQQCLLPMTAEGEIINISLILINHILGRSILLDIPFFISDKRKAEAMLLRCYLQHEAPQWRLNSYDLSVYSSHDRSELEIMLNIGLKYEIEALSVSSISFLSDEYIPSKVQAGAHI
ncbi:hypothetical protein GIB67_013421 [Kingdonia uniflora]|uniref:DNA topoisomerase (ATP-hydrolyzing) n=1 Tax=Kingdonia uniflora TaxID=39325 RepID=A0A7J7LR90_9MAGN|nr:hypothetical protein GIB67_013421 [Kingdonia uniflora]